MDVRSAALPGRKRGLVLVCLLNAKSLFEVKAERDERTYLQVLRCLTAREKQNVLGVTTYFRKARWTMAEIRLSYTQ